MGEVIYKVSVSIVRREQTVTSREWKKGGPDGRHEGDEDKPDAYGYTPQITETRITERDLLKMEVGDLDVDALTRAVLDNSSSL